MCCLKADMSEKADFLKKKYFYRKSILNGTINIPLKAAYPLIGPDCAYHLYSRKASMGIVKGK